jgi:hypothetical protein
VSETSERRAQQLIAVSYFVLAGSHLAWRRPPGSELRTVGGGVKKLAHPADLSPAAENEWTISVVFGPDRKAQEVFAWRFVDDELVELEPVSIPNKPKPKGRRQ